MAVYDNNGTTIYEAGTIYDNDGTVNHIVCDTLDTSDATAGTGDVLSGKTFYGSDGTLKTGTISSKGAATYGAKTSAQTIAAGQYLSGNQTIAAVTQSGLSAANIVSGKTITIASNGSNLWSVTGTANVAKNYYNMNNLGTPSTTRTDNCYSYNLHQHHTTNSWTFHMCNQNTWGYLELTFPNAINTTGYSKLHYSAACTSLEWNSSQLMAFKLNGNAFTKQASKAYSIDVSSVNSLKLVLGIDFTIQSIGALTIYDMYLE